MDIVQLLSDTDNLHEANNAPALAPRSAGGKIAIL
jgi:hypothetical protein